MRSKAALAWVLMSLGFLGCDVSPDGGVCQNNFDCDRTGSTSTRECVVYNRREVPCGSNMNCVCCPRDAVQADQVPGCRIGAVADAGVTDTGTPPDDAAVDVIEDAGVVEDAAVEDVATPSDAMDAMPDVDAGPCAMSCPSGTYCDEAAMRCAPLRFAGQACEGAAECATGYCAQRVCCLTPCTGEGVTCNLDESFRGQCMRLPAPDAGTPTEDAGHGADASEAD